MRFTLSPAALAATLARPTMSAEKNPELKAFFEIPVDVIARDLRDCAIRPADFRVEFDRLSAIPLQQRSPDARARLSHVGMLLAHGIARTPELPLEIRISNVTHFAHNVVYAVDMDALKKGKLADMQTRLDEIRKREGLSADEYWPLGEGPADYQALDEELLRVAEGVSDMIFVEILRRYSLDEEADLFEEDRKHFEILNDTARRVMGLFGEMPVEIRARMDQLFAEEHGEPALRTMRARVAELQLLLRKDKSQ